MLCANLLQAGLVSHVSFFQPNCHLVTAISLALFLGLLGLFLYKQKNLQTEFDPWELFRQCPIFREIHLSFGWNNRRDAREHLYIMS